MITDEELLKKIEDVTKNYSGRIDYLQDAIGLIFVGRIMGWEVVRLTSPRRSWSLATKLFGDPKTLMPRRTEFSSKSIGLKIADKLDAYWDLIKGKQSRDVFEGDQRKLLE